MPHALLPTHFNSKRNSSNNLLHTVFYNILDLNNTSQYTVRHLNFFTHFYNTKMRTLSQITFSNKRCNYRFTNPPPTINNNYNTQHTLVTVILPLDPLPFLHLFLLLFTNCSSCQKLSNYFYGKRTARTNASSVSHRFSQTRLAPVPDARLSNTAARNAKNFTGVAPTALNVNPMGSILELVLS